MQFLFLPCELQSPPTLSLVRELRVPFHLSHVSYTLRSYFLFRVSYII